MLGAATAAWSGTELNLHYLAFTFAGAVAAHISVNALNEYDDCKSGLDYTTQRTPFSGGSGTLPQSPDKAHVALITGLVSLVVTAIVGVYFLYIRGLWLLPVGLVGLVIIVVYTKWITKNAVPLSGSYSWTSFVASLVPFFLVSNLLLLNQFPDVEADRGVGRHHFPIAIGREGSVRLYVVFLAGAYLAIIFGYISGSLPLAGFLALGSIIIAVPTVKGVSRFAEDIDSLIPYMGRNVVIIILTPVLLAIGLFIAS